MILEKQVESLNYAMTLMLEEIKWLESELEYFEGVCEKQEEELFLLKAENKPKKKCKE